MHITYVYSDTENEWNSSEWRCAVPARAINESGQHQAFMVGIRDFVRNTLAAESACSASDVIVVQRSFVEPVMSRIRLWRERGKTVIGDFDDAFDLIPRDNSGYKYWNRGMVLQRQPDGKNRLIKIDPHPLEQFKKGLAELDAVTVSSELLADDWREYTSAIHHVPNFIQLERYKNVQSTGRGNGEIVIGWGGSASHLGSFQNSKIFPALQAICKSYPQVRIMICGNDPELLRRFPIPSGKLIHQPFVDVDQWPGILANFDIGLAPLHGAYDDRRSWIKVLEYLVMSIPWVATESPPYAMFDGYGSLVKNTSTAWLDALSAAIEEIAQRKAYATSEPCQFGEAQDISKNFHRITDVYRQYLR